METVCKNCSSKNLIKKSKSYAKNSLKQVYLCKDCQQKFVDSKLTHKTYSSKIIYAAISNYNLGYTLQETIKIINRPFKPESL